MGQGRSLGTGMRSAPGRADPAARRGPDAVCGDSAEALIPADPD